MDYKLAVALVKRFRVYKVALVIFSILLLAISGGILGYGFITYGWHGIVPLGLSLAMIFITVSAFVFTAFLLVDLALEKYPIHFLTKTDKKLYFEALKLIDKIEREKKEKINEYRKRIEKLGMPIVYADDDDIEMFMDFYGSTVELLEAVQEELRKQKEQPEQSALDRKLGSEPKFKVGDEVKVKGTSIKRTIDRQARWYGFQVYGFYDPNGETMWVLEDHLEAKK